MYLEACTIRNIKCFEEISLDFRNPDGSVRLWNVIIGENGTGKTTLLKAIAIALLGEKAASVLLPRPRGWVRAETKAGEIEARIRLGQDDTEAIGFGTDILERPDSIRDEMRRLGKPIDVHYKIIEEMSDTFGDNGPTIKEFSEKDKKRLSEGRSNEAIGWLAAGYGSFRRITGDHKQTSDISEQQNREARFATLFREGEDLRNCVDWLLDIDNISRDEHNSQRDESKKIRELTIEILNNHILPEDVRLTSVNSKGILFRTPYADNISIFDLSDGYRAVISMLIDIIRQTSQTHRAFLLHNPDWRERLEGVILIDELDVHLHPRWQRQIGASLRKCFPKLQFIITTHSPFIPQMADDSRLFVLCEDPTTRTVQVVQDETSLRGWRADQILTGVFGLPTTRDIETETKLARYDMLLAKKVTQGMSEVESQELSQLEQEINEILPPPGDTPAQRDLSQRMQEYIAKTLAARNGA